jgi:hypothetical protein
MIGLFWFLTGIRLEVIVAILCFQISLTKVSFNRSPMDCPSCSYLEIVSFPKNLSLNYIVFPPSKYRLNLLFCCAKTLSVIHVDFIGE